jgi:uncharacterized repeat protein (TIGR02543 family)
VTNALLTVAGKASGKVAVTNVCYQLNGGTNWYSASTTNKYTNWTAQVTLSPGANSVAAFAVDADGNPSLTNTVKFTYVVTAPLVVKVPEIGTVTPGTVTPSYSGQTLKIGAKYTITAKPAKGFAFVGWTGSISTNTPTLSFVMASNLTFTAVFKDITPPVLVVVSPAVHATVTNALLTVAGKTSDNVGVTNVLYQLNGGSWVAAVSTNHWTNWTVQVTLSPGTNVVAAYAQDVAGNVSKTNSVSFVYKASAAAELAPASISGMTAEISGSSDTTPFMVSFGATTFSSSMLPGTNLDNNSVGDYTYTRLSTNTALLTISNTAPPDRTNHNVVALTFTNSQGAIFTSTNSDGTISTGTVALSAAQDLLPSSLASTSSSVDAVGTQFTVVYTGATSGNVTFTNKTNGEVLGGSYTFAAYSPVGGLITIKYTTPSDDAGDVGYLIPTYSSKTAGSWFLVIIPPSGEAEEVDYGTFSVQ